jgi:Glyoxalase-like domain
MIRWLHVFIDVPAERAQDTERFWSAVTGWPTGRRWDQHPEFVTLEPASGAAYAHIQTIDGRPRVHFDLVVDPGGSVDSERERIERLGATVGERHRWWQVMSSPTGLPFCLTEEHEPLVPPLAQVWPSGHRSRLAQVCIDVPHDDYRTELTFWTEATGWRLGASQRCELDFLYPPTGCPVQLLLRRLGTSDEATAARAHIDLGTDDVAAEVRRLEGHRATRAARVGSWRIMADPATGLPFCVTRQPPDLPG